MKRGGIEARDAKLGRSKPQEHTDLADGGHLKIGEEAAINN
jgi:hypothetical protein